MQDVTQSTSYLIIWLAPIVIALGAGLIDIGVRKLIKRFR